MNPGEVVDVTVTYLEMREPPAYARPEPSAAGEARAAAASAPIAGSPPAVSPGERAGPAAGPTPVPPDVAVRRLWPAPAAAYLRLYDGVGGGHYWVDRKQMPEAELSAILGDPGVEVHVLYVDGAEAGYVELDRRLDAEVRIMYFGLMPAFIGRGLGRWFLEWAVTRSWSYGPRRVWVDTCTLDHPRALPNYQAAGFRIYDRRVKQFTIP